jgi:MFS family permease
MVVGLFLASTIVGRLVTRTGRYKRWMVGGAISLTVGLLLMGTLDETTSLLELAAFMVLVGAGVGAMMQNLVLVVQNTVSQRDMGAGSSLIAFFRSLGGAIGVSALGAVLASKVASDLDAPGTGGTVPDVSTLPPAVARVIEHAYGTGIGEIFLLAAPLGIVALVALILIRETPLGHKSGIEMVSEKVAA